MYVTSNWIRESTWLSYKHEQRILVGTLVKRKTTLWSKDSEIIPSWGTNSPKDYRGPTRQLHLQPDVPLELSPSRCAPYEVHSRGIVTHPCSNNRRETLLNLTPWQNSLQNMEAQSALTTCCVRVLRLHCREVSLARSMSYPAAKTLEPKRAPVGRQNALCLVMDPDPQKDLVMLVVSRRRQPEPRTVSPGRVGRISSNGTSPGKQ